LLGGMWEFPGGKVEENETHAQALIRELREELGITATVDELLGEYHHAYTHFRVTLFAYHASIDSGEVSALQPSDVQWVQVMELDKYPMGKIDRMISRDLVRLEGKDG